MGPGEARELLKANLGSDPWEKLEELRVAGERKARAAAQAYLMEEQKKVVLSEIASEIARTHARENLSEAKLDRLARANLRYKQHLDGVAAAIHEKDVAEAEYWRIRADLEWQARTISHVNALTRMDEG